MKLDRMGRALKPTVFRLFFRNFSFDFFLFFLFVIRPRIGSCVMFDMSQFSCLHCSDTALTSFTHLPPRIVLHTQSLTFLLCENCFHSEQFFVVVFFNIERSFAVAVVKENNELDAVCLFLLSVWASSKISASGFL